MLQPHNILSATAVLVLLAAMISPMTALAQSESAMEAQGAFDALDEPRWVSVITTESGSTYALVASYLDNAVQVIDVTDPTAPVPVASIRNGEGGFEALAGPFDIEVVTASGATYALVVGWSDGTVQVIDMSDPSSPVPVAAILDGVGGFEELATAISIAIVDTQDGTYALVASPTDHAIQVIDVTDPAAPSPVGVIADGDDGFDGLAGASSMATVTTPGRTYVLVTSYLDDAIQIIDMTDPLTPLAVTTIYDAQDALDEDAGMAGITVDPLTVLDRFDIEGIEARAVSAVTDAVLGYAADGERSFEATDALTRHAPDTFVTSADAGMVVAHGVDPSLEGVFQDTLSRADRPLDVILNDISANGGTWVNHMFPHPDTSIIQQKRSWLYEHDGYIFGSGYYLHDAKVQGLVEGAVDRYKSEGPAAFDGVISADGPSIFVHADSVSDTFLHTAVKSYKQIIGELEVYGHTWISYISQNPHANTQQTTRMWLEMYDGHIFGSGYHLPDSRIQSMVEGAQLLYQSNDAAAFDIITPVVPAHTDTLYPFVLEFDTSETVAHGAYPHLLGAVPTRSLHQADRPWPQIQAELSADGSAWASYVFTNPDTRTYQLKRTYLQLYDGLVFASGYYLPDARVQAVVDLAVASYRSTGDDSFEAINDGAGLGADDSLYATVLTQTGTVVASGAPTGFVNELGGLSVTGDRGQTIVYADLVEDGSAWLELATINPATGIEQIKRSWLYLYDDLVFMSGYYLPESEAQSAVDRAVFLYRNEGQAAFATITPEVPASTDAFYPFVLKFDTSETVAHGAYPHLVGKIPTPSLHQGEKTWPQIQEELLANGGTWTSYVFINPDTDTSQDKRTWLYLYDEYVFTSGYYVRDSQVQAIVHNAILAYQADPDNAFAAIDAISEGEPTDTYPFVINASTYMIEAHGANPARNGDISVALTQADRPAEDILADLEISAGTWSHYTLTNPLTGEEENKRSWLSLHDGYIFGSGYYDSSE